MGAKAEPITIDEVDQLFEDLKNWGRWGSDDQLGTLNFITTDKRRTAAGVVSEGITVSASLTLATTPGPNNARPVLHHMIRAGDVASREGYGGSSDYVGMAAHGSTITHLDALCHVFYRAEMYNGRSASQVTSAGARVNGIDVSASGIVSRGVLLDFPRLRGVPWLDPGDAIYEPDLEAAEGAQNVSVQEGDVLLLYTGREKRIQAEGPWDPRGVGLAGLHASAMPWVRRRGVSLLACDGISDVVPTGLQGANNLVRPVHLLSIASMGLWLIDNCGLEDLAATCSRLERWQFCLVIAPLKLAGGTSSPVNPIAIF